MDPVPGAGREAHHVGEIELALRVVRPELGEEPEEQLRPDGVQTWVDLGDGTLDVARVPLFDDAGDLAVGSADDSAIAGGPCEVERHQRQVRARGAVGIEQGAERGGADERHVAVEDEDVAREAGEGRRGARDRVAGPALLRLEDDAEVPHPRSAQLGYRGAHSVRLVPDHQRDPLGLERHQGGEHVADEGAARELVQYLGAPGAHALAQAGGQDDRAERTGNRHGRAAITSLPALQPRPVFLAARSTIAHNIRDAVMSGRFGKGVVVVGWMLAVAACNPLDRFRPTSVNVPPRSLADDDDQLGWAEQEPWVVVVRKACRSLDVYRYGGRVRSFPAVFGLNGSGSKLYEGDRRTPSGLYMIVDKRAHPRWRQFLLLDYPNTQDLHRYWLAMEGGGLPRRGDGYVGAGGAVGIHGTDKPGLNTRNVDWTWGCISLQNADVDDLTRLVPVGTLVLIED